MVLAYQFVVGNTSATDGTWHHIAGVLKSDTLRVYVDGVFEALNPAFQPTFSDWYMTFGADFDGNFYTGTMENTRFWDHARTETQINDDKDKCFTVEPGLVASYLFDGSAPQDSLIDYTGNLHFGWVL